MEEVRYAVRTLSNFFHKSVFAIIRMPGVILVELWFRVYWYDQSQEFQKTVQHKVRTWIEVFELPQFIKSRDFDAVMEQLFSYSVLMFGVTLLLLPTVKLVAVYLNILAFMLLGASYYLSFRYVHSEQQLGGEVIMDDFTKLERHGFHFLSQVMIAILVSCLLSLKTDAMRCSLMVLSLPIVARLCGFPIAKLHVVHNFSCCIVMVLICFYMLNRVPQLLDMLKKAETYCETVINFNGVVNGSLQILRELSILPLLAGFWFALFATDVYVLTQSDAVAHEPWYVVLLTVFGNCCVTPLSLFGSCAAISYMSWLTLFSVKAFLRSSEHFSENEFSHSGCIEAITFLILALQTDLIDRASSQRAYLLCIILFIVMSSLLQSVFDIIEPTLLRISASPAGRFDQHVKALFVCSLLFLLPLVMSVSITRILPLDFWLMIIVSSCIMISVQTLGATFVYALFMYDAWKSAHTWDRLDDLVFVCRSVTRIIEFFVAVSTIGYGIHESIFGEWSWSGSSMLVIHFYVNVWQRLQSGWKSFLMRRKAASQLELLPLASKLQLEALQDVCSICYQEMTEARVTPCNHFFHGYCLKKWLYVQQSCPMCHWDLSFPKDQYFNANATVTEEGYSSENAENAEHEHSS